MAMTINLNSTIKNINRGQFGINISGMFTPATLYEDEYSEDQWQWLSDLRPKVLRFPSGLNGKFMHLLPYKDGPDAGTAFDPIKGYGYDIVEITRYLDAVDNDLEAPDNAEDILDATDAEKLNWFGDDFLLLQSFKDEYLKDYNNQEELTAGDQYIDQFIRLIKKIETENQVYDPSYKVDVIVCLNILTETAPQCRAIIDYLENTTINSENYAVNVVGVEMGNEVAGKFHKDIMRFDQFDDYWNYLDGQPVATQNTLETFLGETLFIPAANRNFFSAFQNSLSFNCKIALCADGLNNPDEYIFLTDPDDYVSSRTDNEWNEDLYSHYGDLIAPLKRKFHAVILHTYYERNDWYDEIVIGDDPDEPHLEESYSCPEWDFDEIDDRLNPACVAARTNFRWFMNNNNGYNKDFEAFNDLLRFDLTSGIKKDLWITEWNFTDKETDERGKVFTNTFYHTYLLQEWWLKNLKLNFRDGFRENFFTYSTLQNYAGGSQIQLLTPADEEVELDILGKDYSPYNLDPADPDKRNYYVKRTTYYTMELLSEINKNNLNYFPATLATSMHNVNMFPTFFIDPAKEYVYMYYTNSKCSEQRYIINPSGMNSLYGWMYGAALEDAEIHAVDAYQAYSTSGKSMLFDEDFNSCYAMNDYDIEIDQTYTYTNPGCTAADNSICIIVPGYTAGYVKIHVEPAGPPAKLDQEISGITIYLNPASTTLQVQSTEDAISYKIISMYEAICSTSQLNNSTIDISMLPAGAYQISFELTDCTIQTQTFIKAQ